MQLNHDQDCCDPQQLEAYLSDSLADTAAVQVEEHLSSCHTCRERLDQAAFTQQEWQRTQALLRPDDLDSALLELHTKHGQADRDLGRNESAMLSREIQGWLDPTDDPAMLGRFAGYEIVGIVGHGGMGIVLKGFESSLNRYVAIKILAPRLATNGTARKRFAREARAAAAVLHENVIAIHRVDEWHGLPFLVMPYIAGVSLQKRIDDEGPLSIEATLRVGMQIAAGLAAAHAQGLVHRDIKPANILLDQGVERVTITDFGLARAADDASMTRTGVIAGTPQYMSPEQAEAKAMDARSDLFSLGSVLYTMAAGRPPFRGEGSFEVLKRIVHEPARPMREIEASVPDWFERIVSKLHSKNPLERPSSADAVSELLETCLAHVQQPTTVPLPASLITPAVHRTRRPPFVRFIAAAAFAFSLLFAGVLIVLELNKGKLTIECEADDVPIRIMQGDEVVEKLVVTKEGKSVRVAAGEYIVEVDGDLDGIVVDNAHVSLTRRKTEIVKIARRDQVVPDSTAGDSGKPSLDAPIVAKGKRLAKVLGQPVYEGEINKNVGDKDNLVRLLFEPLMEHYCQQQGIDRDAELKDRIKDEPSRAAARMSVMRADLNRHLYEKYGGRVQLTAFGPVAVDAQRKWLEDRKKAGDFIITDTKFQEMFDNLWVEEPQNAIFASPDQIKEAFDPAITDRFIDSFSKIPAGAFMNPDAVKQSLAELPASVNHDFASDGLPRDRFNVRGEDESEQVIAKPDGLHVTHLGTDGYSNTFVETLKRIHGDFEVTVSFKDLTIEPGENGSGGISLTAILENTKHTHGTVHRGATVDYVNPIWNFVQSEFVHSPQRDPGVVWIGTTAEEATSGRLRLARVGETLYSLFAAGDSPEFRLIHAEPVGSEDLLYGGIRLITQLQSNNNSTRGTTSVIWKDITIRAERITDWPAADSIEP